MNRHEVVSLPPGLREPPRQKLVKRLQFLQPPVLPRPDFTQVPSQFNEAGVPFGFRPPFPGQDLVNLGQNEQGPLGLSLGNMGGTLERKLVKPTKVVCSSNGFPGKRRRPVNLWQHGAQESDDQLFDFRKSEFLPYAAGELAAGLLDI
jgi:hypothetical protein